MHLQHGIITVESIELLFQNLFVGVFLFLKRLELQQPSTDNRRRGAAVINEMLNTLFVLFDIALVVDIRLCNLFSIMDMARQKAIAIAIIMRPAACMKALRQKNMSHM